MFRSPNITRVALSVVLALAAGIGSVSGQEEGARVTGRVLDQERSRPVEGALVELRGTEHRALTDSVGIVRLMGVEPGTYAISVEHLSIRGVRLDALEVPHSGDVEFSILINADAIELEPIVVSVMARRGRSWRGRGGSASVVTRQEIEASSRRGDNLGTILERHVTGITTSLKATGSSSPCVEFRGDAVVCHPPLVVVDGARISSPAEYLDMTPPQQVESMEVLPSAEASSRYGTGSARGVVRIETRRPDGADGEGALAPRIRRYNWNLEPGDYPWARGIGGAALGTLGGLALALVSAGDCSPLNESRRTECPGRRGPLAAVATLSLPVLGAAFGANALGKTEWSQGVFGRTLLMTSLPMLSGYFFATPHAGDRSTSGTLEGFGSILVAVGVPIAATLADRMFRVFRGGSGER